MSNNLHDIFYTMPNVASQTVDRKALSVCKHCVKEKQIVICGACDKRYDTYTQDQVCPHAKKMETLADILAEEEVKQKPDPIDVRDTLITYYCRKCPDHEEDHCADHECFIWRMR